MSLTSCFSLDLVQHLLVSFALLYFVFYILSKLLFVIYFSNCLNCSPSFDSSVFFYFVWKYIKENVFVWTVKSIFGLYEQSSGTVIPTNHQICIFFSLLFIFFELMMLLFCSAYQHLLSKSPTSCSSFL